MLETIKSNSDILIMLCSIAFTIALIPQVWFNFKNKICGIPYKTSIPTAIFMFLVTLVYISNDFWLSVIMGSMTTLLWVTISMQRYKYKM